MNAAHRVHLALHNPHAASRNPQHDDHTYTPYSSCAMHRKIPAPGGPVSISDAARLLSFGQYCNLLSAPFIAHFGEAQQQHTPRLAKKLVAFGESGLFCTDQKPALRSSCKRRDSCVPIFFSSKPGIDHSTIWDERYRFLTKIDVRSSYELMRRTKRSLRNSVLSGLATVPPLPTENCRS